MVGVGGENYLEARTDRWNAASETVLSKNGFSLWKETGAEPERDAKGVVSAEKTVNVWRLWKPGCNENKVDSEETIAAKARDD